jgi:Uma2 family endonuclease
VIEIVSPDDKRRDVLARFRDYDELGVRHLLLLDPEGLTAYRSEKGSLGPAQGTSLDLPSGELPFDIGDLFRQLAERRDRGATLS